MTEGVEQPEGTIVDVQDSYRSLGMATMKRLQPSTYKEYGRSWRVSWVGRTKSKQSTQMLHQNATLNMNEIDSLHFMH